MTVNFPPNPYQYNKNPVSLKVSSHKINIFEVLFDILLLQISTDSLSHCFRHLLLIFLCLEKFCFLWVCEKSTLHNVQNTFASLQQIISFISLCLSGTLLSESALPSFSPAKNLHNKIPVVHTQQNPDNCSDEYSHTEQVYIL